MNKKGFTLVEVLGVIVVLTLISFLVVPKVADTIFNSKEVAYKTQVSTIENAARKYGLENDLLYPREGEKKYISVSDLVSTGELSNQEIVDPRTGDEMNGYVLVEYNDEYQQYDYTYVEEIDENVVSAMGPTYEVVDPTKWTTTKNVTIVYPKGYDSYEYKIISGKVRIGDQIIEGESNWFATNELRQTVVFLTNGSLIARVQDGENYKNGNTLNVGYVDPTAADVQLGYNPDTLTTNKIDLVATCTDAQSGVTKYEFKIGNGNWIDNGMNNVYSFTELNENTKYDFSVRCTNGSGMTSIGNLNSTTQPIGEPTFIVERPGEWQIDKDVTTVFPDNYTRYEFNIISGTAIRDGQVLTNGTWYIAQSLNEIVNFVTNGEIAARVYDGNNLKYAVNQVVNYVDPTEPTCTITFTGGTTNNTWYNVAPTVTFTTSTAGPSGFSYGTALTNNPVYNHNAGEGQVGTINITDKKQGTNNYYGFVKTGAGNTATCNVTLNLDTEKPVVALTSTQATYANNTKTVTIPLKITEVTSGINVADFTASDIVVKVGTTTINPTKTLVHNSDSNGVYNYTLTLSGLTGNGALTLVVNSAAVTDNAGNSNAETTLTPGVTVDNTAPSISVSANGTTYQQSSEATITLKDTGGSGLVAGSYVVKYAWGTSPVACASMTDNVTITATAGATSVSGKVTISEKSGNGKIYVCNSANIGDRAGNTLNANTISSNDMYLDNKGPSVPTSELRKNSSSGEQITLPNNANTWYNTTLWWGNFKATDDGSGVDHYEFSSRCTGTKTANLGTSYTYSKTVHDEYYCIRAVDSLGNAGDWSSPTYIKVDKVAPVISNITKTANGTDGWGTTNTLSWTITEANSGIQFVDWCLNPTITTGTETEIWASCSSAWHFSESEWSGITRTNERNDKIYVRVVDKAGNISNLSNSTLTIDRTNPTASSNPNGGNYSIAVGKTTINVQPTLSAGDALSGVRTSQYGWSTAANTQPTTWADYKNNDKISKDLSGGDNFLWFKVTDKAGNVLTTKTNTFNAGYAVEYDANGGTTTCTTQRKIHGTNLTLCATKPTRDGYTFVGWATAANSKTKTYDASGSYTANASVKLYAVWKKTLTATFDKNGATSVGSDTLTCDIYNAETSCVVKAPAITRAGFTIVGWGTTAAATTGTAVGQNLTISNNTTFYAITKKVITITFNKNGAISQTPKGGTANTANTLTQSCTIWNSATTCSITSPTIAAPTNTPVVVGYNTTASATTSTWAQNTAKNVNANATYYAITKNNTALTATFTIQNSATATATATSVACTKFNNATSCNIKAPKLTATTGYTVVGWNTNSAAVNSTLNSEATVAISSNITYYSIISKPISSLTITVANATYTGSALTPAVTVKDGTTTLANNKDYTLSYANNTNVGTGNVTITSKTVQNATTKVFYTGNTSKNFSIGKANSNITFQSTTFTYSGVHQSPKATVTGTKGAITYAYYTDSKCATKVASTINAATYYVIATAATDANYNTVTSGCTAYTINKKPIGVTWSGATTFTYNAKAQGPTVTATVAGVSNETLTLTNTKGTAAAKYTSKASCSKVTGGQQTCNNYTLTTDTKEFTINKATPTITLNPVNGTVVVKKALTFTATVKSGSTAQAAGKLTTTSATTTVATVAPASIDLTATETGVGSGNITVTTIKDGSSLITVTFTPTDTANFNSAKATYTANVLKSATAPTASLCKANLVYTGGSQTLTNDLPTDAGYTLTGNTGINANTYTVTAKLSNGYRWSDNSITDKTFKCSIAKATPILTLSPTSGSVNARATITFTEKANVKGKFGNVSGTIDVATVSPAVSSNEIAANAAQTVTVTGVSNGTSKITVTFTPTDTTNYTNATGTYTVTGYKVANQGTCAKLTYNGASQNLVTGNVGVTLSNNNRTLAGSQEVTATLQSGYRFSDNTTTAKKYTCNIAKKAVTITAKAQTITFGKSIATGVNQVTPSGLVSGHTVASVTLAASTTAVTTNGTITPSAATINDASSKDVSANYTITYGTGKLVINKAGSTVTLAETTAEYTGKAIAANTATVNGTKGEVTYVYYTDNTCKTQTTTAVGASATGKEPIDAGVYYVKATAAADASYNTASSTCVKHTITTKAITVSWGTAATFTYNAALQAPTITSSVTGVNGETLTLSRTTFKDAGSYTSTASCTSVANGRKNCSNYSLKSNTKTFTINKVTPTITLNPTTGIVVAGGTMTFTATVKASTNAAGTLSVTSATVAAATVTPATASVTAISTGAVTQVTVKGVKEGSSLITVKFTPIDTKNFNNAAQVTYTANVLKSATIPTANTHCNTGLKYTAKAQTLTKTPAAGYTFSGNIQTNAGEYEVTANLQEGYRWSDNTTTAKKFKCSIAKATPVITLKDSDGETTIISGSNSAWFNNTLKFNESANVAGTFTVDSEKTTIATVSQASANAINANTNNLVTVTGKSTGISVITVNFTPTDTINYNSAAAVTYNVQVDKIAPKIAMNGKSSPSSPTSADQITIPIKITEANSGINTNDFEKNDIIVKVNSTTASPSTKVLTYDSFSNGVYSYTLKLSGIKLDGSLTLTISSGAVKDLAGNSSASTTLNTGVSVTTFASQCKEEASQAAEEAYNSCMSYCKTLPSQAVASCQKSCEGAKTVKDTEAYKDCCQRLTNSSDCSGEPDRIYCSTATSSTTPLTCGTSHQCTVDGHTGIVPFVEEGTTTVCKKSKYAECMEWCDNPTGGILGVPCTYYCAGASQSECVPGYSFPVYYCHYEGYIEVGGFQS